MRSYSQILRILLVLLALFLLPGCIPGGSGDGGLPTAPLGVRIKPADPVPQPGNGNGTNPSPVPGPTPDPFPPPVVPPSEPPLVAKPPVVTPPQADVCTVDRFRQDDEPELKKVDILFVMDTSSSMGDDWERVALNIREMVRQIPADADIRYAVILGHVGTWQGKLFSASNRKVLSNLTMTAEAIGSELYNTFRAGMRIGDPGSGEATFHSLYFAVTKQLTANQKEGFFRPDATLEVLFASDEQEIGFPFPTRQSPGLPPRCDSDFEDGIKRNSYDRFGITVDLVANAVKRAKGDMPFSAHALVNITPEDLFTNNPRGQRCLHDSLGYGYFEMVNQSRGVLYSLQQDTGAALSRIGAAVRENLQLTHDFRLSKSQDRVEPETIQARVDGVLKPHRYDEAQSMVRLTQVGHAGSSIEIRHCEPRIAPPPPPPPPPPPVGETWQIMGFDGTTARNSARLIWQTPEIPTKARVLIGLSPENLNHRARAIGEFRFVHFVDEDGLEPNTRYYFKIIGTDMRGRSVESNIISKRTKQ